MNNDPARIESRVKSKGYFELFVAQGVPIAAELYDISPSGICLGIRTAVQPGTKVHLLSNGFMADGVVRYCKCEGEICRVGVALIPPDAS